MIDEGAKDHHVSKSLAFMSLQVLWKGEIGIKGPMLLKMVNLIIVHSWSLISWCTTSFRYRCNSCSKVLSELCSLIKL